MTLEQAVAAAIEAFNFGNSLAQIPSDFIRVYPKTETVEVRCEPAQSRKEAAVLASLWGQKIRKNFDGDFSITIPIAGQLAKYSANFYGDVQS